MDVIYYLKTLECPTYLTKSEGNSVREKVVNYYIHDNELYWKYPQGVLLKCVIKDEDPKLIQEMHANNVCGGHFAWKATTHKILYTSFCWTSLFSQVNLKV